MFGKLFSVCGMDLMGYLFRIIEQYDFYSGKVKYIFLINISRSGVGVVVLDGRLYVVGGYDGIIYFNRLGKIL